MEVSLIVILGAVVLGVLIAATCVVVAAAIQELRVRLKGTLHPTLDQLLVAVTPWAMKAIAAGERSVLWGLEELNKRIEGLDKKAVADAYYNLIPDVVPVPIGGRIIPVPVAVVKRLVTREEFANLVKTIYDQFDMEIDRNIDNLKKTLLKRAAEETKNTSVALPALSEEERSAAANPTGLG